MTFMIHGEKAIKGASEAAKEAMELAERASELETVPKALHGQRFPMPPY